MKKRFIIIVSGILLFIAGGLLGRELGTRAEQGTLPAPLATPKPTPLAQYSIDNLTQTLPEKVSISRNEILKDEDEFTAYGISLSFQPAPKNTETKQTSGMVMVPKAEGSYPLLIMIRGYADQKIYYTGLGTRPAGEYFVKQGFITIAPDFLGYANSDSEAGNIFETRFQTYTTMLSLLQVIDEIPFSTIVDNKWDRKNIFIWAHSNGGQVALTTLAITGRVYPTTFWAPVTKPFPYSVLYYTDESVDGGKFIRSELSKLESVYDVDTFSFTKYLDRIKAPLQFHQGTADDAIPFTWTQSIVNKLKKQGNEVIYHQYPGSDHNLRPAWDTVVEKDVEFFRSHVLQ